MQFVRNCLNRVSTQQGHDKQIFNNPIIQFCIPLFNQRHKLLAVVYIYPRCRTRFPDANNVVKGIIAGCASMQERYHSRRTKATPVIIKNCSKCGNGSITCDGVKVPPKTKIKGTMKLRGVFSEETEYFAGADDDYGLA